MRSDPRSAIRDMRAKDQAKTKPRWGWLEIVIVAQTAIPALLFVPGLTPIRLVTRVASFAIALVAWGAIVQSGRRAPGRAFPAVPWLWATTVWLLASILHPTTNSLLGGVAEAALIISVFSPAFWGPTALESPRQLGRLMVLLLLCNGAGALMGIGQYYWPDRFNPPVIPMLEGNQSARDQLSFTTDDGRKVLRPCGLTDTPAGASIAGGLAFLVGVCWAIRPIGWHWRLASLGVSLIGAAVLLLSQVRSTLLTQVGCLLAMIVVLFWRGDYRRAIQLVVVGVVVFLAGLGWVVRSGGLGTVQRFMSIIEERPDSLYYRNRGFFLDETFNKHLWDYPMGAGMGRWGQPFLYFGDHMPSATRGALYVEIQWTGWVFDGGLPLMALYSAAIVAALWDMLRIARTSPDDSVGYWAAVVFGLALSVVAATLAGCPFNSQVGVQFWALLAPVHAADARARLATRTPAPGQTPRPLVQPS
jgi:hypothetical protein